MFCFFFLQKALHVTVVTSYTGKLSRFIRNSFYAEHPVVFCKRNTKNGKKTAHARFGIGFTQT